MQLEKYNHEMFGSLSVAMIDNKPHFIGKEAAKKLGYKDTTNAIKAHCRGVVKHHLPHPQSKNKTIEMNLITEGDLYRLVFKSELPAAEKFESWVMDEVLPKIRENGSYGINKLPQTLPEALRQLADTVEQRDHAIATKAEIGSRREATSMARASAEKRRADKFEVELDQSKQYATVKRMEMLYHGQKFKWRELKSTSKELDLPPIDVFDQNYGTVKAYHADVWKETYALEF